MSGLLQDLRVGLRLLRKSPAQMAAAVVTLALGIAAVTTVFGWVDAVLLRPLPGTSAPHELAAIEELSPAGQPLACAHPDFRDFQRGADLLSGLAASHFSAFTVGSGDGAQRVFGQIVSANFFAVLGVKPVIGRVFSPEEDRDIPGGYPYAVISDRMWRGRFGADSQIVGRPLRINGRQLTVIGVAPPDFPGSVTGLALDLWVPLSLIHEMGGVGGWPVADRNAKPYSLIGRLKPGVRIEQAAAQVQTIARRMAAAYPATHAGVGATALPIWKAHSGVQVVLLWPLRILAAVSLLVLLIASANVANLLLARSVSREKEYGVRLALGANRYRLLRQALAEALLLAAAGTAAGMLLTQWMGESLKLLLPPTDLPLTGFVSAELNGPVIAFAALVCGATALLSGVVPGLHSTRPDLASVLNEGGRNAAPGRRSHRARKLLVIGEVALASLALIVAGLFGRSFQNIGAIHLGLDPTNVQVAQLYLASAGYTADRERQFCRTLSQRLQNVHGIESATYAIELPLVERGDEAIQVEGYQPRVGESTVVSRNNVGPGYFRLLRIPLLAGREFDEHDEARSPRVLVVNQEFARRFFGDTDPIGRRVRIALGKSLGDDRWRGERQQARQPRRPRPALFLCSVPADVCLRTRQLFPHTDFREPGRRARYIPAGSGRPRSDGRIVPGAAAHGFSPGRAVRAPGGGGSDGRTGRIGAAAGRGGRVWSARLLDERTDTGDRDPDGPGREPSRRVPDGPAGGAGDDDCRDRRRSRGRPGSFAPDGEHAGGRQPRRPGGLRRRGLSPLRYCAAG